MRYVACARVSGRRYCEHWAVTWRWRTMSTLTQLQQRANSSQEPTWRLCCTTRSSVPSMRLVICWQVVHVLQTQVCYCFILYRHSEAKWMFSTKSLCLFVCLFVNTVTSERLNIGWWDLEGRCIVQKSRLNSNFRVMGRILGAPTPQNEANWSFHKI